MKPAATGIMGRAYTPCIGTGTSILHRSVRMFICPFWIILHVALIRCALCASMGGGAESSGGVHFFPQPCHGRLPSVRLQTSRLKPYAKVPPPPGDQPAWVLSLALSWEPELRMVWGVSSPGSEHVVAEHQGFMLRLSWLA